MDFVTQLWIIVIGISIGITIGIILLGMILYHLANISEKLDIMHKKK